MGVKGIGETWPQEVNSLKKQLAAKDAETRRAEVDRDIWIERCDERNKEIERLRAKLFFGPSKEIRQLREKLEALNAFVAATARILEHPDIGITIKMDSAKSAWDDFLATYLKACAVLEE